MHRTRVGFALLAFVAIVSVAGKGGAELRVALEDRADPNPRQMAVGLTLAGTVLGLAISWTDR